jgi:hypothetical protein
VPAPSKMVPLLQGDHPARITPPRAATYQLLQAYTSGKWPTFGPINLMMFHPLGEKCAESTVQGGVIRLLEGPLPPGSPDDATPHWWDDIYSVSRQGS